MYKLCVYVPEEHCEEVKEALFEAGAGKIGDYDSCAWQKKGEGQFPPLKGSNPYIGQEGSVERVPEYKVEMVCADQYIEAAVRALKKAHPYEEPAFDVWRLGDIS